MVFIREKFLSIRGKIKMLQFMWGLSQKKHILPWKSHLFLKFIHTYIPLSAQCFFQGTATRHWSMLTLFAKTCKGIVDMPLPEDTVAVVELFHLSNFTNLESNFSGNSKFWSSESKFEFEKYWIMVSFQYTVLFLQHLYLKIS